LQGFATIEDLVFRVDGITHAANATELAFPVTFSDIGVVATLASDVETYAGELERAARRLQSRISVLRTLMAESAISTATAD
jgi:hypothetical protein